MANGKYAEWTSEPGLDQLTNWSALGYTHQQMADGMGINVSTLYEWMQRFPEISDAIKRGRSLRRQKLENTFLDKAAGGLVVTETIEEFRGELREGKPYNGSVVKRTVKKTLPPDTTALIFYLKNHAGYRDNPPDDDGSVLAKVDELLDRLSRV